MKNVVLINTKGNIEHFLATKLQLPLGNLRTIANKLINIEI